MQGTTLIENGDTGSASGGYSVTAASQPTGAGAQSGQRSGVGFEAGGPAGDPVIKFGSIRLGFEDVFLILIALQTLGVVVDLVGEVRR
jgi:uncharacterized membrane protein